MSQGVEVGHGPVRAGSGPPQTAETLGIKRAARDVTLDLLTYIRMKDCGGGFVMNILEAFADPRVLSAALAAADETSSTTGLPAMMTLPTRLQARS